MPVLLPIANFIVQCLLFAGLAAYTYVTWRILSASRKQIEVSQEQVEAAQKPFVSVSTTARDGNDAILNMHGAVGAMMVLCPGGSVQLANVGAGPAINIRYLFEPVDPDSTPSRPSSYLASLHPGETFLIPTSQGLLAGQEWNCLLTFESLSGRRYQTELRLNGLVITDVKFVSR
ncbi:MAG TPA: hypothetical protein VGT24_13290 [Candidatus Acidoferrales bacterium]|nr:hypothetical protein [Candidatus Acidoferrales bacterium]